MKKVLFLMTIVCSLLFSSCDKNGKTQEAQVLKDALADNFTIGVALNENQITGKDAEGVRVVVENFNSIVAEDCMKAEEIQPREGVFDFRFSDRFVEFGKRNNLEIIGHTLIWHSQLPYWFAEDKNGGQVSPELLKKRMKSHIETIMKRYKGRVKGWDVVNEAILDDGSYRENIFYQVLGEEYIPLAFQYAHNADPQAELYYNDYSMAFQGKREGVVRMVKKLQAQGIRIDGVGMQSHIGLDNNILEEFEKSIVAFSDLGVKVMITELDMSVLPFPTENMGAEISLNYEYQKEMNPYQDSLPAEISKEWNNYMLDFFKLLLKHSAVIDRVTLWGVSDGDSWKNNWPINGRTDYPLLFDRNYQPKAVVGSIIDYVNSPLNPPQGGLE